jgi:hypothetical protein
MSSFIDSVYVYVFYVYVIFCVGALGTVPGTGAGGACVSGSLLPKY